jgi:transposase
MHAEDVTESSEDLATMRKALLGMAQEKGAEAVITMLVEVLGKARAQNTQLQARLEQLLRQLYGRKSEKVSTAQLSLLLQGLGEQAAASAPPSTEETAGDGDVAQPAERPRRLGGRKPRRELPANLARETKTVPVPARERVCARCGTDKQCIGHLKSEVLEFVPAHFKIVELLREKLACPKCESGVVTAPSEKVMDRGRPGPGLLANLLVEKFQDAMPLYRQAQGYERCGVSLSESTLVCRSTEFRYVLSRGFLPVRNVDSAIRSGRCSSASLRLLWPTWARASTPSYSYPSSRAAPCSASPPHAQLSCLRALAHVLAQARQGRHAPRYLPRPLRTHARARMGGQ